MDANPFEWTRSAIDAAERLGWTVFTQTGQTVTRLTSSGSGLYGPLDYPGQTFYFSRVMTEELDAATLQLGTADRSFAVFLDGELIYTDCPEQDNRVGHLQLTHHGADRTKNVTVSLPPDYVGRTLTIAQSTSEYAETKRMLLNPMPCSVKLYCGFAYESALIMNLLDNALQAAKRAQCPDPFIGLDMHVKSGFFVFVCENSADVPAEQTSIKETVPKHGLGLKIVRQIADKYGALLQMTQRDGRYKAELAIPLDQPSK